MTMPHLMNCPHSADGWCLDCVKKEHENTVHAGMGSDLMAFCGEMLGISGSDQVKLSYVIDQVTCVECLRKKAVRVKELEAENVKLNKILDRLIDQKFDDANSLLASRQCRT